MAKPGDTSNNLLAKDSLSYSNVGAQNRSLLGLGKTPATDLVIIAIGTNDHGAQATTDITANAQPGTIPDTYEANIRALANQAVSAGASVLLLAEGRRPNPTGTYSEQEYWDRMKKIALDTDHVSFMDINDVWGSNTLGNQLGYYTASSVHPTLKGHGSMARIVYNALARPFGFNSPTF
jgi:lysophospholipase L1-like esterase